MPAAATATTPAKAPANPSRKDWAPVGTLSSCFCCSIVVAGFRASGMGEPAASGVGAGTAGFTQLLLRLLLLLGLLPEPGVGVCPSVETDDAGLHVP
jgi:hypothetical protein